MAPSVAGASTQAPGIKLGKLDPFLGFRLRRVQNLLSKDFAQAIAAFNMRSGQFSALAILAANPGLSQSELAGEVGLDKSVIVLIIDELEKRGWARRERSKTDRRRHALYVLPAGEEALTDLISILDRTENIVRQNFTAGELDLLHGMLDRIHGLLQEEPGDPDSPMRG